MRNGKGKVEDVRGRERRYDDGRVEEMPKELHQGIGKIRRSHRRLAVRVYQVALGENPVDHVLDHRQKNRWVSDNQADDLWKLLNRVPHLLEMEEDCQVLEESGCKTHEEPEDTAGHLCACEKSEDFGDNPSDDVLEAAPSLRGHDVTDGVTRSRLDVVAPRVVGPEVDLKSPSVARIAVVSIDHGGATVQESERDVPDRNIVRRRDR